LPLVGNVGSQRLWRDTSGLCWLASGSHLVLKLLPVEVSCSLLSSLLERLEQIRSRAETGSFLVLRQRREKTSKFVMNLLLRWLWSNHGIHRQVAGMAICGVARSRTT
jgi:hypothetical protein